MRKQVGDRSFKYVDSLLALLIVSATTCGLAFAQERQTGGRMPSAEGAEVYFIDLKDGASVPTKVTVRFGLREMGVVPAGFDRENSGHHHLLIDTELPPLDEPIPNDFNHLHFGAGQTEAQVTLKPGLHTLQLLLGDKDHIPHNPPVMSSRIRVIVSDVTASPQVASTAVRAQAPRRTKAQENALRSACRKDFISHCSKVNPSGPAALACLQRNAASLSSACRTAVSAAGGGSAAAGVAPASPGTTAPTQATLTPTQAVPAPAQDAGGRIGTPRPTKAQENALRSACRKDFISHCSKVNPSGPAALACLQRNAASLSSACRTAVSAVGGGSGEAAATPAAHRASATSSPYARWRRLLRQWRQRY